MSETDDNIITVDEAGDAIEPRPAGEVSKPETDAVAEQIVARRYLSSYVFLPFIFLTVALLGGLRLSGLDGTFIFLRPSLLHLIFAVILLVLFVRARLIDHTGWFGNELSILQNIANGTVLISLFAASTQLFNSLIPEQGLPFWVVSFCFFWTLWNNLFADFDTKKLLRSLGGLFGIAFIAKYLILANLAAPAGQSWLRSLIENPGQATATWLLDIPQFAGGTGYIQFFAVILFLFGLILVPVKAVIHK